MRLYNALYDRFLEYVKNRDVICYGAGKMLDEMCEIFPKLSEISNSISIVDGDANKHGAERIILGKLYFIQDIGTALRKKKDAVILITSAAVFEILDVLKKQKCEGIPVFSFLLMRKENYENTLITIEDCDGIMGKDNIEHIPRQIHYFWFGGKDIPDDYKRNMETWVKNCPNYEIVRWDENNCDIEECPYAKEAYVKGRYGFVPDYFRLKIIYDHGGIYLDTDVKLLKPLDELLLLDAYAGFEDNEKVAFGVGFGARKGFPLLKEMYESYMKLSFVQLDGSLNTTASPTYQTEILKKHGLVCNGRMQIVDGMTILPMNYLTVQSNHTGRRYLTNNSFSIHQYAASWFTDEDRNNKHKAEELLGSMEMI